MARLTNSVRVIVLASSGCCAMAVRACAAARASPSAGPTDPIASVIPAVNTETEPISPKLSMLLLQDFLVVAFARVFVRILVLVRACCGRDVDHRENREDVGLDNPRQQPEQLHDHREEE